MLMSINEAIAANVPRIRLPKWACQFDHFELGPGVWIQFYSPMNKWCENPDPTKIMFYHLNCGTPEYEQYFGPLSDSDEYKAEEEKYNKIDIKETPNDTKRSS